MPPEISIITVYYNTPEELLALYESAKKYLPADRYEFIVADNASRDDLSGQLPGATYLRLPENFGFGKANNLAAAKARGRYLFFVNPDCRFVEDAITPLASAMAEADVAGPRVINEDGTIQISFGPALTLFQEALQSFRVRHEDSTAVQNRLRKKTAAPFSPGFIGGCALMIRADLYREIGGFDEHFFLYQEDVDLCKRIRDRGLKILYVPNTSIVHLRSRAVRKEPAAVGLHYRKSQIYYYRKHNGLLQQIALRIYLSIKYAFNPAVRKSIWNGKTSHR